MSVVQKRTVKHVFVRSPVHVTGSTTTRQYTPEARYLWRHEAQDRKMSVMHVLYVRTGTIAVCHTDHAGVHGGFDEHDASFCPSN